jgi:acetyltransferase
MKNLTPLFYPRSIIIGAYLEGVKNGSAFIQALKRTSRKKPMIIWKGGRTPGGGRAASSHTGSLGGSKMAWGALKSQRGVLMANNLEELIDFLTAFYYLPKKMGKRLAILSGPGGPAVSAADACEEHGLQVAEFQPRTREQLKAILPKTGTSVNNPVELGLASVFEVDLYGRAAMCVGLDPGVDALIFQGRGATPGTGHQVCYFVGRGAAKDPETFPGNLFRGLVPGAAISGCSHQGRNPCLSFR